MLGALAHIDRRWTKLWSQARQLALAIAAGATIGSCSPTAERGNNAVPARPQLIAASTASSEVRPLISAELAKARAQHATLLVYVGATWCEPCRHFHDALTAGELDASLPDLRFLEFDYDR